MTMQDIEAIDREFLDIAEVAAVLGTKNPQMIRVQAHKDPAALGFPVIVYGRRVKVPKAAFMRFMRGDSGVG